MAYLTAFALDDLERLSREATQDVTWEPGSYTIGASGVAFGWELFGDNYKHKEDAAYLAAALNSLPALIAEVRAARRGKALDALSEQAQELGLYEIKNPPS